MGDRKRGTSGAGTAYHSEAHEFTSVVSEVRGTRS
jgi:hypothetical protein